MPSYSFNRGFFRSPSMQRRLSGDVPGFAGEDDSVMPHPSAPPPHLVHVPTPGDHYSAATGSAVMTVIYEFNRCHAKVGGQSSVIVGKQTRHDYPVGTCLEFEAGSLPRGGRKLVDAAMGLLGRPRPFERALYRPTLDTLPKDFDGVIFLHNAAASVQLFKDHFHNACICLWPHNDLFSTYSAREARATLMAADRLICVSWFIANKLIGRVPECADRICVVNNGVDTDHFHPSPVPPAEEEPLILFVGRVTPQKAPDLIIHAALRLAGKRRFRVRIVGNAGFSASDPLTPYEEEIRRLAVPLGQRVQFQTFLDRQRIFSEFAAASIFVVPSNWDDPCPLTVGEGLACGLPCVLSRRGGIAEMAADAAIYFSPPNVDELTERLEFFLDQPEARVEWGQRARQRALETSWQRQYRILRGHLP
jgi:glycosyltransferase involved in cell wall biosynthesis